MSKPEIVRTLGEAERVQGEVLLREVVKMQQAWVAWCAAHAGPNETLRPGTWDVVRTPTQEKA